MLHIETQKTKAVLILSPCIDPCCNKVSGSYLNLHSHCQQLTTLFHIKAQKTDTKAMLILSPCPVPCSKRFISIRVSRVILKGAFTLCDQNNPTLLIPNVDEFFFGYSCLAQVNSLSVVATLDFVPSSISQFVTSFNISCQSHPSHAIQSFWVNFEEVIWHLIGSLLANLSVAHRYLKNSRLFNFSYVPATRTSSSKGIFAAVTNSTNQTNKAGGTRH